MTRQLHGYRFGDFEVSPEAAQLWRSGEPLHLEPRVLMLLVYLIEHRDQMVAKQELLDAVWDETFVTENALTKAIGRLRKALADDADRPEYIQTHHRLGYRFVAEVDEVGSRAETLGVGASVASGKGRGGHLLIGLIAAAAVAAIALLLGLDPGGIRQRLVSAAPAPDIQSLAVLPLANLTNEKEKDYFVEGMQEALITDLSKIGSLRVISRQSVMRFRGSDKSAPQIARELGVDGLVEGSVMRDGERVVIWAQLIHGPSDTHLWAETYDRDLGNVLVLLNEVARAISREIRITLTPEQTLLLAAARPVDPAAHDAYLRARHHLSQFTDGSRRKAAELFRTVIELDPKFAQAHAGLAYTHLLAALGRSPPAENMPAARIAALEALELDDRLAEAYTVLGVVQLTFDWNWRDAGKAFRRALELNPNDPTAHHGYADYLTVMGRSQEALEHVLSGRRCDPFSPITHVAVMGHLAYLRRYDELAEESRKVLELFPGFRSAHMRLGSALWSTGRYEEALAEFGKGRKNDPEMTAAVKQGFELAGPSGAQLALAETLVGRSEAGYTDPLPIAAAYARAGEVDPAIYWLEKAFENRSLLLALARVDPDFDSLRSDPRFRDLTRRMGLPELAGRADL